MSPAEPSRVSEQLANEIAERVRRSGLTVGCAESLTGGQIATTLAAAPESATWFRGGVVAYAAEVKFEVLGVPPGPVITEKCARAMAVGARRVLGADVAVSVTGVGGPGEEEGQPAGTVWLAVSTPGVDRAELQHFDGDPAQVVRDAGQRALELLRDALV
ncbi:MAG TPA: CinA family protein [Nakamurella sp.]|nr:CinA family protein [Nakamurella sp.]